jgi:hypothetical protein
MSRYNTPQKESKPLGKSRSVDGDKKDAAGNAGRSSENERNLPPASDHHNQNDFTHIAGLNRSRLNDLYERSSI